MGLNLNFQLNYRPITDCSKHDRYFWNFLPKIFSWNRLSTRRISQRLVTKVWPLWKTSPACNHISKCWNVPNEFIYVMRCSIWYHLNHEENVKNTFGGVLLLAYNFTKSNTPPWMFFTFFRKKKRYQIMQSISYV